MINRNPSNVFNVDQGLPSSTQINTNRQTDYVYEFISLIVGDPLNVWEAHALAPTRKFTAKVLIRGIEYSDENIVEFTIEESVNPDESFMIGSVASTKLDLTVIDTEDSPVSAVEDAVVRPFLSLEVEGEDITLPMGVYYAEKVEKKKGRLKITCFDSMVKFEKPYSSHLTYPASLQAVAQEICSRAGVTLATTLPNIIVDEIQGYTLRQAIGFVASFVGGFARFNRDGELEIRSYDNYVEKVFPSNYFDLQTPENTFTIGRLTCKVGENEEGEIIELTAGEGGNEVYFENPIMTQAQLESIYSTLRNINYLPYELNWQGDPALQAGDRIRITDTRGVVFESLVMDQQIKYTGGFTATTSAKAKSETAQEFSSSGTLTQKVERQEKEIVNNKREIKRRAEELTEQLNQRIGDVNADIESLLQRANGVDGTLTTIHTEIDDINGSLSSTITQLTNLDGVVSEHSTTLQQHYDALLAKAEKTEVYTRTETDGLLGDKVDVLIYNNKMTALDLTIDGLNTTVTNTTAEVNALTGEVTTAKNQIGELDLRADGFETSISDISGDLTGVSGRLTSAEGSITALAGEVALKATQSEVDTLEGRMSEAEGSIITMAGQISSKAESTVVDALGTQVTTVQQDLDAVNGELINKVSTTDFNGETIFTMLEQTPDTFKFTAARIEFDGHVFGEGATFTGNIDGGSFTARYAGDNPNKQYGTMNLTDNMLSFNESSDYGTMYGETNSYMQYGADSIHYGFTRGGIGGETFTISPVGLTWTGLGGGMNGNFSLTKDRDSFGVTLEGDELTLRSTYGEDVRILSSHGYGELGARNADWFHFDTDRPSFYFYKPVTVNGSLHLSSGNYHGSGSSLLRVVYDSRADAPNFLLSMDTYKRTYGSAANVHITENGVLGRSTSASKYKLYIKPVEDLEFAERVLNLVPSSWFDKGSVETYANYLTKHNGNVEGVEDEIADTMPIKRHYGLIAEDLVSAGLSEYVVYGKNGEVESIEYDRVVTLLIPIVKNLKEEVNQLKEMIA